MFCNILDDISVQMKAGFDPLGEVALLDTVDWTKCIDHRALQLTDGEEWM